MDPADPDVAPDDDPEVDVDVVVGAPAEPVEAAEVLLELGYDWEAIARLKESTSPSRWITSTPTGRPEAPWPSRGGWPAWRSASASALPEYDQRVSQARPINIVDYERLAEERQARGAP